MKIRYTGDDVVVINYKNLFCGDFFIILNEDDVEEFFQYEAENIYLKTLTGCVSLTGINKQLSDDEQVVKIEIEISWREA